MSLTTTTARGSRRALVLVVCLSLALTLTAASRAGAESVSVQVTARVAPTFELTLLTDGAVSFGEVRLGAVYEAPEVQTLRIRSGRTWDLTDSSDTVISVGSITIPRERIVRHAITPSFADGVPAGVYTVQCRYTLDLTSPEALSLPPGTPIVTTFGYTAVQE